MTDKLLECDRCGEVWPVSTGKRCRECDLPGVPYREED